ncbi:hypothetical protein KIN20_012607 [Parelaphostrongylus tenuis]|uniref:Uncharacterized protein n=1 Tax=Parelaphostrongylus tenuis TaxID=148309 RepID=A0AAD5QQJ6_PARTN|nr:hypothetical protein KIN20_012607 [Parelaphostrongylus tenuis]
MGFTYEDVLLQLIDRLLYEVYHQTGEAMLRRSLNNFLIIPRLFRAVSSVPVASSSTAFTGLRHRIDALVSSYEDFIGVKAVKEAHAGVMMWEEKLSEAQIARRNKQAEIKSLQSRLKEIHAELDRTSRSEDKYLHLLTEEHATIKKERVLLEDFEGLEAAEREAFYQLSNRVRASHEREREQRRKRSGGQSVLHLLVH